MFARPVKAAETALAPAPSRLMLPPTQRAAVGFALVAILVMLLADFSGRRRRHRCVAG